MVIQLASSDLDIPTLQKLAGFKTTKDRLTFHTSSAKSKQIKSWSSVCKIYLLFNF